MGVEWPEFRTIEKVVIRFGGEGKAPRRGRAFLEYWNGTSVSQGAWAAMEDQQILGQAQEVDGSTWSFTFSNRGSHSWMASSRRTSKLRLRLQEEPHVEIAGFEVYGPSEWRSGEVHIEWGHGEKERSYDGSIECYNGEVLEIQPSEDTRLRETTFVEFDRRRRKVRRNCCQGAIHLGPPGRPDQHHAAHKAGTFSFLPEEAIEDQPIDIPGLWLLHPEGGLGSGLRRLPSPECQPVPHQ